MTSEGVLDASTALSTGYSFLTGGAKAVAANLAKVSRKGRPTHRHNMDARRPRPGAHRDTGTRARLDQCTFHFGRALLAIGNTTGTQNDLVTTTDVLDASKDTYAGRLLFSMGCPGPGTRRLRIGGQWLQNTDLRLGQDLCQRRCAVGGQHRLRLRRHSHDRLLGPSDGGVRRQSQRNDDIGAALTNAKQTYDASNAVLSPYDLKAVMESTFYGLPCTTSTTTRRPRAGPSPSRLAHRHCDRPHGGHSHIQSCGGSGGRPTWRGYGHRRLLLPGATAQTPTTLPPRQPSTAPSSRWPRSRSPSPQRVPQDIGPGGTWRRS